MELEDKHEPNNASPVQTAAPPLISQLGSDIEQKLGGSCQAHRGPDKYLIILADSTFPFSTLAVWIIRVAVV